MESARHGPGVKFKYLGVRFIIGVCVPLTDYLLCEVRRPNRTLHRGILSAVVSVENSKWIDRC
jgi:hypothetical protein